jgi:hypothetical protein
VQEWVALMRAKLGVGDGSDVLSVPYAMPVEPLCPVCWCVYRAQVLEHNRNRMRDVSAWW